MLHFDAFFMHLFGWMTLGWVPVKLFEWSMITNWTPVWSLDHYRFPLKLDQINLWKVILWYTSRYWMHLFDSFNYGGIFFFTLSAMRSCASHALDCFIWTLHTWWLLWWKQLKNLNLLMLFMECFGYLKNINLLMLLMDDFSCYLSCRFIINVLSYMVNNLSIILMSRFWVRMIRKMRCRFLSILWNISL